MSDRPRRGTPVRIVDSEIPEDHFILAGIDVSEKPIFDVTEVSKMFFARSAYWLRWADRKGHFVLDGEYVGGYRHNGLPSGERRYTLAHVEQMAHALAEKNVIKPPQLVLALRAVAIQAELWGYIKRDQ